MSEKGQASLEALFILSAIILAATSLQVMGENSFETANSISSARKGVQTAITRIAVQSEIKINISDWRVEGDNINCYLVVQGSPPPENETITRQAENVASAYLEKINSKYGVKVEIEKRIRK